MTQEEFVWNYKHLSEELEETVRKELEKEKVYKRNGQLTVAFVLLLEEYSNRFNNLEKGFFNNAFQDDYTNRVKEVLHYHSYKPNKELLSADSGEIDKLRKEWSRLLRKARKKAIKGLYTDLKQSGRGLTDITKMTERAVQRLNENGISTFKLINKNGKLIKYDLAYYSKLVTESSANAAKDIAVIRTSKRTGNKLVQFSSHSTTCIICSTYCESGGVGRIYSLTRESNFPYLYDIPNFKTYHRMHPNCLHFLKPVRSEDITDKDIKRSNLSFTDHRTKKEREAYDKEQKRKQRLNYEKKKIEKELNNNIIKG